MKNEFDIERNIVWDDAEPDLNHKQDFDDSPNIMYVGQRRVKRNFGAAAVALAYAAVVVLTIAVLLAWWLVFSGVWNFFAFVLNGS